MDYIQRMKLERKELAEKGDALSAFIWENPLFGTLDSDEQELMRKQSDAMFEYEKCLSLRIELAINK